MPSAMRATSGLKAPGTAITWAAQASRRRRPGDGRDFALMDKVLRVAWFIVGRRQAIARVLPAADGLYNLAELCTEAPSWGRSRAKESAAPRPVRLVSAGKRTAETNFVAPTARGAGAWESSFPDPLAPPFKCKFSCHLFSL